MNLPEILVGCDPEIFVKQNGIFMSAYGLIVGDKKNPQKVPNGAVQVDGMALEFNIDPAHSEEEFIFNVQDVYNTIRLMVPTYEVVATPVADFSQEYLNSQPAAALELGCDPDYNAWVGEANPRPDGNRPMRTASGHVHIGWTDGVDVQDQNHINTCELFARQCDFYLGLPSLVYDNNTRRREMYGKAGAYRPKPYGVEYRTLSNAWLNSKELMGWVYRAAQKGITQSMLGNNLVDKYGDIQEIINTSNVKEALAIIKAEKIEVCYG
jgi:hypothetical protein